MRKILLLASNPKDLARLRLDQEIRDISEGLQRSNRRNEFELVQRWAVRPRDLQRAMLTEMPQIVHFAGHGKRNAGLCFEDEFGNAKLITESALESLFQLFSQKAKIECVVLNGCYSLMQAEAIAQYIPYVIGIKDAVGDLAAIEFAVGFYDALGNGESVEFAFESGKVAMKLSHTGSEEMPVLMNQGTQLQDKFSDISLSIHNASTSYQSWNLETQAETEDLVSEKIGVSYTHLKELLTSGFWQDADEETANLMCEIMCRQKEGWLRLEDINEFPSKDLKIIDRLWVESSKGRFGFSVQKSIWQDCGRPLRYGSGWEKFGDCVGWRSKFGPISMWHACYQYDFTFDTSAPRGHLPSGFGVMWTTVVSSGDCSLWECAVRVSNWGVFYGWRNFGEPFTGCIFSLLSRPDL